MSNRIKFIEMKTFLFSDLTSGFKVINSDGFEKALNYINILNTTDVSVIISFDGQYGFSCIKPSSPSNLELYSQICNQPTNNVCLLSKRTSVYVKKESGNPKTGQIIVMGYYIE